MQKENFVQILEQVLQAVKADDTSEGRVAYQMAVEPGIFHVDAFVRIGASLGQGGCLVIQDKFPPAESEGGAADGVSVQMGLYYVHAETDEGTDVSLLVRAPSEDLAIAFWRTYFEDWDLRDAPSSVKLVPVAGPAGAIDWKHLT